MNEKVGPWVRVGVPGNVLERWRHGAADHLRPLAQYARGAGRVGPGRYISQPPARPNTSARSASRLMSRTRMSSRRSRRGRRRRRFQRNYRGRNPVPYSVRRVLKSVLQYSFDASGGNISVIGFNLNNPNDPYGLYGTGQPLGHDQWSAFYERCAVIGGTIGVECVSLDGSNPVIAGVNIQTSPTALSTFEHYKELPHTALRLMTPEQDKTTFSLPFSVPKFFHHRKIMSDDRLSANIGSDPTDVLYAHLFTQVADKTADQGKLVCVITIRQIVVYFKPKTLARS